METQPQTSIQHPSQHNAGLIKTDHTRSLFREAEECLLCFRGKKKSFPPSTSRFLKECTYFGLRAALHEKLKSWEGLIMTLPSFNTNGSHRPLLWARSRPHKARNLVYTADPAYTPRFLNGSHDLVSLPLKSPFTHSTMSICPKPTQSFRALLRDTSSRKSILISQPKGLPTFLGK